MPIVGPGQGTDDTEFAMALAQGLFEGDGVLDLKKIVTQYGTWIQSHPFGILLIRYWCYY